ncbi:MAG: deaminase, partial [Chloroflexi bacterium]|nr:deaminase [Chloroflexota bacterium]
MRQPIHILNAPQPKGPYSQAIVAQGKQIYVSSQGGYDPATGKLVSDDFKEQARQVFANLQAILAAAGATLDDVVKVTVSTVVFW